MLIFEAEVLHRYAAGFTHLIHHCTHSVSDKEGGRGQGRFIMFSIHS